MAPVIDFILTHRDQLALGVAWLISEWMGANPSFRYNGFLDILLKAVKKQ